MQGSTDDQEQKLKALYGDLPTSNALAKKKLKERKYFDSGDYALQQQGRQVDLGSAIPTADQIPHSHPDKEQVKRQ